MPVLLRPRPIVFLLVISLVLVLAAPLAAVTDPTYALLRGARPDGRKIPVRNLVLERDAFRFQLDSGTFYPLAPVDGRTIGAVFVGQGSYRLIPATPNETRQLALASGADKNFEVLTDTFETLLFLFTDDTLAELERHAATQTGAPDSRAADVYDRFLKRQQKDFRSNFHLRILEDLLNAPGHPHGVFLALIDGRRISPALAAVDPDGAETLRIAPRLGGETTVFQVADAANGGTWYLCDRKEDAAHRQPRPVQRLVDALDYKVETEVQRNADIAGKTTVRFETLVDGLRVLPVSLLSKLRIGEAAYAVEAAGAEPAWKPLAWIQEEENKDADAAVVFPEPLPKGATVRLRLAYQGNEVLQNVGGKTFVVGARESWYPNLGIFSDPAKFELIYRIPLGFEVVSVGKKAEDRTEGKQRVSVWRTETPVQVAGFNYGKFEELVRKDDVSGLQVEVFTGEDRPDFGPEVGMVTASRLADSAAVDGVNAARIFTTYFGPLPQTHVAITQQAQWNFGQSWPSLIFLPYASFLTGTQRAALGLYQMKDFINQVGFHEFAHQWWGHQVAAATYRDEWLEEGFAEFSAALAVQHTQGWNGYTDFWRNARKFIFGKYPGNAIAHDKAGPISQGWRLSTPYSPAAAQAMIYSKGAYVLHMLRMLMWDAKAQTPDANFIALMKDFAATYSGRSATTADFQKVVERHMVPTLNASRDGTMNWFFDQWVYGTDVPRYVADLKIDKADGDEYRIHGQVTQQGVSKGFRSLVPLQVEVGKNEFLRIGSIGMTSESTVPIDVKLKLPKPPKRALVNANGEVLARD